MRLLYFVVFSSKKIFIICLEKIKDWSCKNDVVFGDGSKFLISANVINISRNRGCIKIGRNTLIRGELLTFRHSGEIIIGDYCYIGEMTRIWSASKIIIGDRVLIAHNVNIHDNNAHPIDAKLRHEQFKHIISSGHPKEDFTLNEKPIIIEDDVWIGFNSTILKGVIIGKGAIVAACSVVNKDVEPYTVVAGNPAMEIKKIIS